MTDRLYTDDDAERGAAAQTKCICPEDSNSVGEVWRIPQPDCPAHGNREAKAKTVLDAVLPAIRVRWMKELAEGKADCFDLGWMARETEVNGLLETIERLRRQLGEGVGT